MSQKIIETFDLYGEIITGGLLDPFHLETIKERSHQHDWTIRPHKHDKLAQIFLFKNSGIHYQLDQTSYESQEGLILFIPPNMVHGFHFPKNIEGDVLSVQVDGLGKSDYLDALLSKKNTAIALPVSETLYFQDIVGLIEDIKKEYQEFAAYRIDILKALINALLIYIYRNIEKNQLLSAPEVSLQNNQANHIDKFCAAVEDHYQDKYSITDYSELVGVSAPHLTRLCRKFLGMSPQLLIRHRRLLEAKRLLKYTRLSIQEVAISLGFEDAAYFCRTFKKNNGVTPVQFRQQKGQ